METAVFKQACINVKQYDCIYNREYIFYYQIHSNDFENQINCTEKQNYFYSVRSSSGYSTVIWPLQGIRIVNFTEVQLEALLKFQNKAFKNINQKPALECCERPTRALCTNKTWKVLIFQKCQISCVCHTHPAQLWHWKLIGSQDATGN